MPQREADCHAFARYVITVPIALLATLLFLAGASQPAQSQTYSVIYNFTAEGNDGGSPYGGPTLDHSGNLYGTTYTGGTYGSGSVYRLSPNGSSWTYDSLYSFKAGPDGVGPGFGSLALGPDGALFGTTEGGGYFGTAFAICACAEGESQIHSFGVGSDGAQPIGGLVMDSTGNFYGTASLGGAYGNGTVYEEVRSGETWTESTLYSFIGTNDGTNPASTLSLDANGNIYGTTSFGGANDVGMVFELSPSGSGWEQTVLYTFQGLNDGQNPLGGVTFDEAGNLYGTTFDGGVNGGGTVYELSPSASGWTFSTLYSFTGIYGGPYNKLALSKGNLYGATLNDGADGFGSVFELTRAKGGWKFTDLYDFAGASEGAEPYGSVAVDSNGNIFGTTNEGGSDNQGLVFEITP